MRPMKSSICFRVITWKSSDGAKADEITIRLVSRHYWFTGCILAE